MVPSVGSHPRPQLGVGCFEVHGTPSSLLFEALVTPLRSALRCAAGLPPSQVIYILVGVSLVRDRFQSVQNLQPPCLLRVSSSPASARSFDSYAWRSALIDLSSITRGRYGHWRAELPESYAQPLPGKRQCHVTVQLPVREVQHRKLPRGAHTSSTR